MTLAEIKDAIKQLPDDQLIELEAWITEEEWAVRIDAGYDLSSGQRINATTTPTRQTRKTRSPE